MPIATMTSKGQVTVPAEVRRSLGLVAGTRVDFVEDGAGFRIEAKRHSAKSLYGLLPKPSNPVTLEDMEATIARGAILTMGEG